MADINSFILYFDIEEQFDILNDEQAGKLIKAIIRFAKYGEMPDFDNDGMLKMAFSFISSQIKRDFEKYEQKCERNRQIAIEREQKKRESTNVHEREQTFTNSTYNNNKNNNKNNNNIIINNNSDIICKQTTKTTKKFVKPSIEDVKAYCSERGNYVDAERFVDYYEANGWKVGKNNMKDWKAAVRTWERNEDNDRTVSKTDTAGISGLYDGIV